MANNFEPMQSFFESMATKEHVAQALLRVLGNVDVEAKPELKNDRDMLITFVETLL